MFCVNVLLDHLVALRACSLMSDARNTGAASAAANNPSAIVTAKWTSLNAAKTAARPKQNDRIAAVIEKPEVLKNLIIRAIRPSVRSYQLSRFRFLGMVNNPSGCVAFIVMSCKVLYL